MKASHWRSWERYLPSAKADKRGGAAPGCLKLGEKIVPEEGIEERMTCKEPLWRPWEKSLPSEVNDSTALPLLALIMEDSEKAHV